MVLLLCAFLHRVGRTGPRPTTHCPQCTLSRLFLHEYLAAASWLIYRSATLCGALPRCAWRPGCIHGDDGSSAVGLFITRSAAMATVGILTFSDGRAFVAEEVEEMNRGFQDRLRN